MGVHRSFGISLTGIYRHLAEIETRDAALLLVYIRVCGSGVMKDRKFVF